MRDFDEFLNSTAENKEFQEKLLNAAKDASNIDSDELSDKQAFAKWLLKFQIKILDINREYLRAYHEWLSSQLDEPSNHR